MSVRTYDRETYQRLVRAWEGFGPEWTAARQLCTDRGYPFPPAGDPLDDREGAEPSQRSIVWRALDYRPLRTLDMIRTSRSWSEVVRKIVAEEDRLREDATYRERDAEWEKQGEQDARQSLQSLAAIVHRIQDSAP
jgi:hypothetical protein